METLVADLPKVWVKGKRDGKHFEIKTVEGDVLMTGFCHWSKCGGWPESRFTMQQENSSFTLKLKGEASGCCSCDFGKVNTEVSTSYGNVIGHLKGDNNHQIKLSTVSNDELGKIVSSGFFSRNRKITLAEGEGKMDYDGHISCDKYLVIFPEGCPGGTKFLIVAAALEMTWRVNMNRR